MGIVKKFDWDSGDNLWHIDTINTHKGKLNDIYKWTIQNFRKLFDDKKEINWVRLTRAGDKIKRINNRNGKVLLFKVKKLGNDEQK